MNIGIAGFGLLGRLFSFELVRLGHNVSVFDSDWSGQSSAAVAAAGMLCPYSEIDAQAEVRKLGASCIEQWQCIAKCLGSHHWLTTQGSLIVAHPQEKTRLKQFSEKLVYNNVHTKVNKLERNEIIALEPELDVQEALYFPHEGAIDSGQLIQELGLYLKQTDLFQFHKLSIKTLKSAQVVTKCGQTYAFDWVIDCRGLGAKKSLSHLRGVRGELIHLFAPEVRINRTIRMLHPRYHLYIVPRQNHQYVIGASEIESEDLKPITVRTTLELLTSAFSIHSGFAEAHIIDAKVGLRPTLPNHQPKIDISKKMITVNGLYRHGYMLAPQLVNTVINQLFK